MNLVVSFFHRLSPTLATLFGAILITVIGTADYLTGPVVSLSILYLIPVMLITWRFNRLSGVYASLICALVGLLADYAVHELSSSVAPIWNAIARLGVYVTVTWILSSFLIAQSNQDEMIHYMVHDLRSPLANVIIGLNLLVETEENALNPEQKQLIEGSLTSGAQLMTLVNSILDLSQLRNGKMPLTIQPTIVDELFSASTQQVSAIALDKMIDITTQVGEGAESIMADRELTKRILVNLISNAVKHSPAGASVVLKAKPQADKKIVISVSDSGVGIPPEWLGKVFGRFVQVVMSEKETMSGSGLGLRFCRLAVEAQDGRIWLESKVGSGTTVAFTLPRVSQIHNPTLDLSA